MSNSNSGNNNANNIITNIPAKERALVLQGGGSLGAYEAGAYKALYEWLSEKDKKEERKKSSTFDIIAGTSIGAMNAAVLTSYVIENGTYEGSAERLIDFWNYLSKESIADTNPWFKSWWDYLHSISKSVATGEAARRYYSAKEFSISGVPNAFSPLTPMPDNKFFDLYYNTWYRFSNKPLKRSLEKFAKFPIATSYEENEPRLILVSVDVADGLPVTFDSYAKEDGFRKTEYGRYIKEANKEIGFERVIRYNDGITLDQVMASGCYPVNFDYASLEVESYYEPINTNTNTDRFLSSNSENSSNKSSSASTSPPDPVFREHYRKETRYFWDGGMMSNTPLTQLILLHRNYWFKARGLKDKVPTLSVCVINVHPTRQKEIPTDHDGVVNRNNDITFSDRSHREEEVLLLISDYIDLVRDLISVARDNGVKDEAIDNLLNQRTKYHGISLRPRLNKDIVQGRFDIDTIVRIERKNDEHTISDKTFDFSSGTINHLLNNGYKDTIDYINTRTN